MNKYVDTHNHALWDMDDGVKDEEEALQLLLSAQKSNIGVIFVTPHFIPDGIFAPNQEKIIRATLKLRQLASDHRIDIKIRYGCEFRINDDAFDVIDRREYTAFENTGYVLIEFTRQNVKNRDVMDAIDELTVQGKTCIIAHPERYFDDVFEAKNYVNRWRERGCVISVNRTSLLNEKRVNAYRIAWELVDSGLAHIIATDAHHGNGPRMCILDDIHQIILDKHGEEVANMLFFTNPWHIVNNENVEEIEFKKKRWKLF